MREKIERLAREEFKYNIPKLIVSDENICIYTEAGKDFCGFFEVKNSKHERMKGLVYSSNHLLKIETEKFIGENNKIEFTAASKNLEIGDEISGNITLVTDCGEKAIPFCIKLKDDICNSIIGEVKSLEDFAEVAKESFEEGTNVFYTTGFKNFLAKYDKRYISIYNALTAQSEKFQAVEEFLCAACKKALITFDIEKTNLVYEISEENFKDTVIIKKSGWGYLKFKAVSNSEFVKIVTPEFSTSDFAADVYKFDFIIEPDKLVCGKGFAYIKIITINKEIELNIVCNKKSKRNESLHKLKERYSLVLKNYLDFRLGKKSADVYSKAAMSNAAAIKAIYNYEIVDDFDSNNLLLAELYNIHALITIKDAAAAEQQLEKIKEKVNMAEGRIKVVYMYLKLLGLGEGSYEEICMSAKKVLNENRYDVLVFFIYLCVNNELDINPIKKLESIKNFSEEKYFSPVILYEAAKIYRDNPYLLRGLSSFEISAVNFAFKNDMADEELALQFNTLVLRKREYSLNIFRLLTIMYKKYNNYELLNGICSILIRGRKLEGKYFEWYKLGMKEQIKTAQLFEYYLESARQVNEFVLEPPVYLYYSEYFNGNDTQKAYLYATLLRQPLVFEHYKRMYIDDIEEFISTKLNEEKFSDDLNFLYTWYFERHGINERNAAMYSKLMFAAKIVCKNPEIKYVTVIHDELEEVQTVTLIDSSAYISIYSKSAVVFLCTGSKEKYIASVDYELHYVNDYRKNALLCYKVGALDKGLLIYLSSGFFNLEFKNEAFEDNIIIEADRQLMHKEGIKKDYIKNRLIGLIEYYSDEHDTGLLENYLLLVDLHSIPSEKVVLVIECMIRRELYNIALKTMEEYGFERVDISLLKKLCLLLLKNSGGIERVEILLKTAVYVFINNGFNDNEKRDIIKYIIDYYSGPTDIMYRIRNAAADAGIDTYEYDEKLLGQMLFAESMLEYSEDLFISCKNGGAGNILLKAYILYMSYRYLTNLSLVLPEIIIKEAYEDRVCRLAVLKYYSLCKVLSEEEINISRLFIEKSMKENIVLPFFISFKKYFKLPLRLYDKTAAVYLANPGVNVFINYRYGNIGEFAKEEVKECCYGIFIKNFIIFKGEYLEYFFEEHNEEDIIINDKKIISREENCVLEEACCEHSVNAYERINNIIDAWHNKKEDEAVKELLEFKREEFLNKTLFKFMF